MLPRIIWYIAVGGQIFWEPLSASAEHRSCDRHKIRVWLRDTVPLMPAQVPAHIRWPHLQSSLCKLSLLGLHPWGGTLVLPPRMLLLLSGVGAQRGNATSAVPHQSCCELGSATSSTERRATRWSTFVVHAAHQPLKQGLSGAGLSGAYFDPSSLRSASPAIRESTKGTGDIVENRKSKMHPLRFRAELPR